MFLMSWRKSEATSLWTRDHAATQKCRQNLCQTSGRFSTRKKFFLHWGDFWSFRTNDICEEPSSHIWIAQVRLLRLREPRRERCAGGRMWYDARGCGNGVSCSINFSLKNLIELILICFQKLLELVSCYFLTGLNRTTTNETASLLWGGWGVIIERLLQS